LAHQLIGCEKKKAMHTVLGYKSQFLTISDFTIYFWYIRMNVTQNNYKVEFSIIWAKCLHVCLFSFAGLQCKNPKQVSLLTKILTSHPTLLFTNHTLLSLFLAFMSFETLQTFVCKNHPVAFVQFNGFCRLNGLLKWFELFVHVVWIAHLYGLNCSFWPVLSLFY